MTVTTPVGTGGTARRGPSGGPARWWPAVPVALAVGAAAALLLPWWRAPGPLLLGGGPLRALPPEIWTGTEVAGVRAVLVGALAAAALAVAMVGALSEAGGTVARVGGATAGAAAAACGAAAVLGWGPTGAPGAWVAVAAGLAAVGAALLGGARIRTPLVLGAVVVAAAGTVALPGGAEPPDHTAVGPYRPVAAVGPWAPARSGAAGLSTALDGARPVLVDGAPGIVGDAGIILADREGRAQVLARTDEGAPPPLGVAAGRVVRWITADALAVTELRADGPLQVVVRDVGAASRLGDDGSVWLRSVLDPPETVRRLDVTAYDGRQDLSATYLPVVTIQNPDGEGPVDVREVLPVPGGALRLVDLDGVRQLQMLAGTPAGIRARPLTAATASRCTASTVSGTGHIQIVAADASGVWFPADGQWRLSHLGPDGTVRTVGARLPGPVEALAAPGDGSVLFLARDVEGLALWRLPDAVAALGATPAC